MIYLNADFSKRAIVSGYCYLTYTLLQRCREKSGTCCGEKLTGFDPNPYRHQVVEIPPIQLHIEEHRLHQLSCHHCGQKTRATLPEEVVYSGYGERVVALVSLMSGMYRHSHRMVLSAMSDFFGVKMSLGSINRLRTEASEAVSRAVDEALPLHPIRADSGSR